jgi:BMFP domain-containing protein YqiC
MAAGVVMLSWPRFILSARLAACVAAGQIAAGKLKERVMPQTRGQIFDDVSRLFTDVAGLADSARREVETLARAQLERLLASMNLVSREEFEAVREMAARARDDNDKLAARIAELEAKAGPTAPVNH